MAIGIIDCPRPDEVDEDRVIAADMTETCVTVDLNPDYAKLLKALAKRRDMSATAILRRALVVYGLIVDAERKGWPVVVQDPDNMGRDVRLLNP